MATLDTINDPANDSKLLLDVFTQHVRNELREKLRKEADKIIDDCCDKAIEDMRVSIHTMYDMMNTERFVKVVLEKKNAHSNS